MRRELLEKVTSGGVLDRDEALEAGRDLAAGRTEPLVAAAFLGALSARGERPEELAGLASAFREAVKPFPQFPWAVDTCGTGGDGRGTFNVSTAAALTAAALGVPVAKHGNRSVSSACGSADFLEALGYPVSEEPAEAEARFHEWGFAFLFAPRFHPAMAHVASVRKAIGVRTVFNLLGPMLNPAGVRRQVVGVFDPLRQKLIAESFVALGAERAIVVHGEGGYDECILHERVFVAEAENGALRWYELGPEDFGQPAGRASDLAGGSARENALAFLDMIKGRGNPGLRAVVAANTALALRAAKTCEDLREGTSRALEALETGAVGRYLACLITPQKEGRHARMS
jgi:anthranilate phosphoribosyltransferase